MKTQRITKVIRIYSRGTINACTKCCASQVDDEIFHRLSETLLVLLYEMSGDHESHYESSYGDHSVCVCVCMETVHPRSVKVRQ